MTGANTYALIDMLLKEFGIPRSEFADALNLYGSQISDALRDGKGLERHMVTIANWFAEKHNINSNWLLRQSGPKFLEQTGTVPRSDGGTKRPVHSIGNMAVREIGVVTVSDKLVTFEPEKTRVIPAYGIVQVQPDDMAPVIRAGQSVLVAPYDREPSDGDIVVVETINNTFVRRWRVGPDDSIVLLEHANQDRRVRTIVLRSRDIIRKAVVVGVLFE